MKNRTRENCTSGSVRDEAGQPPHLLGRRTFLHLAAGAAALPAVSRIARAQAYPSRPITIIEPFVAGGPLDTIGRIMAERMRVPLGQPVIIENVAGASGTLGIGRVARAVPDGYTISPAARPRTFSPARSSSSRSTSKAISNRSLRSRARRS